MPIPALAAAALASPAVGSAIGAAGNIIGGLLGKSAQKSANKMNYKIAQETNAAMNVLPKKRMRYNTKCSKSNLITLRLFVNVKC